MGGGALFQIEFPLETGEELDHRDVGSTENKP
jgi:hypothetical protein